MISTSAKPCKVIARHENVLEMNLNETTHFMQQNTDNHTKNNSLTNNLKSYTYLNLELASGYPNQTCRAINYQLRTRTKYGSLNSTRWKIFGIHHKKIISSMLIVYKILVLKRYTKQIYDHFFSKKQVNMIRTHCILTNGTVRKSHKNLTFTRHYKDN